MVNAIDKVILVAGILCCVLSVATCQNAPEANNSTDLSEGLSSKKHKLFRTSVELCQVFHLEKNQRKLNA